MISVTFARMWDQHGELRGGGRREFADAQSDFDRAWQAYPVDAARLREAIRWMSEGALIERLERFTSHDIDALERSHGDAGVHRMHVASDHLQACAALRPALGDAEWAVVAHFAEQLEAVVEARSMRGRAAGKAFEAAKNDYTDAQERAVQRRAFSNVLRDTALTPDALRDALSETDEAVACEALQRVVDDALQNIAEANGYEGKRRQLLPAFALLRTFAAAAYGMTREEWRVVERFAAVLQEEARSDDMPLYGETERSYREARRDFVEGAKWFAERNEQGEAIVREHERTSEEWLHRFRLLVGHAPMNRAQVVAALMHIEDQDKVTNAVAESLSVRHHFAVQVPTEEKYRTLIAILEDFWHIGREFSEDAWRHVRHYRAELPLMIDQGTPEVVTPAVREAYERLKALFARDPRGAYEADAEEPVEVASAVAPAVVHKEREVKEVDVTAVQDRIYLLLHEKQLRVDVIARQFAQLTLEQLDRVLYGLLQRNSGVGAGLDQVARENTVLPNLARRIEVVGARIRSEKEDVDAKERARLQGREYVREVVRTDMLVHEVHLRAAIQALLPEERVRELRAIADVSEEGDTIDSIVRKEQILRVVREDIPADIARTWSDALRGERERRDAIRKQAALESLRAGRIFAAGTILEKYYDAEWYRRPEYIGAALEGFARLLEAGKPVGAVQRTAEQCGFASVVREEIALMAALKKPRA